MGSININLQAVRVAGIPTFIPGSSQDTHHLLFTIINNRGQSGEGKTKYTDELTCHIWGKYAEVMAHYISKGREISINGDLRSYSSGEGKSITRKNEVRVNTVFLGAEPYKVLNDTINGNIALLKMNGRLPQNCDIKAVDLLQKEKPVQKPYDVSVGGTFGQAKVWTKGQGFDQSHSTSAPITDNNAGLTEQIAAIQQQLLTIMGGQQSTQQTQPAQPAQPAQKAQSTPAVHNEGDTFDPFSEY